MTSAGGITKALTPTSQYQRKRSTLLVLVSKYLRLTDAEVTDFYLFSTGFASLTTNTTQ